MSQAISTQAPNRAKSLDNAGLKRFAQVIVYQLILSAVLFAAAGRLNWLQGWAYTVLYVASVLTMGIVGARNRSARSQGPMQYRALHTDAGVNRGNLGGPLIDLEGRVVGVLSSLGGASLTEVGANSGVGFAIPTRLLAPRLDALRREHLDREQRWRISGVEQGDAFVGTRQGCLERTVTGPPGLGPGAGRHQPLL